MEDLCSIYSENLDFTIRKTLCEIEFLEVCLENNLTPKFVNSKLYRKDIRHSKQSTKFQTSLLNNELSEKKRKLKKTSKPSFFLLQPT